MESVAKSLDQSYPIIVSNSQGTGSCGNQQNSVLENTQNRDIQSESISASQRNAAVTRSSGERETSSGGDAVLLKRPGDVEEKKRSIYRYDGPMEFAGEDFSEPVNFKEKANVQNWDPTSLLTGLYYLVTDQGETEDGPQQPNEMTGYLDKLPRGHQSATLTKSWKRRYFRAKQGNLFYSDSSNSTKVNGVVQLLGGDIKDVGNKMLQVVDLKGDILQLRFSSQSELDDWKTFLHAQTLEDTEDHFNHSQSLVMIDLGSCSVRAGVVKAGHTHHLPQLFFPSICLESDGAKHTYGFEAVEPSNRQHAKLYYPFKSSYKINKFDVQLENVVEVLHKVFEQLGVESEHCTLMMTLSRKAENQDEELVDLIFRHFNVERLCIQDPAILALYSYNITSGVIVNVGDSINVVPVVDGCIIEKGVSNLPFGGAQVTNHLVRLLSEKGHRFFSEVESLIARHLKEKICYVSQDYEAEMENCQSDPGYCSVTIDMEEYNLPDGTKSLQVDSSRFRCTEGLFHPEIWGIDTLGVDGLIVKAIQACSMDSRKEMARNVYLSGGSTLLPGFAERLQKELETQLPKGTNTQVHINENRLHSTYEGASILSDLSAFEGLCITKNEWIELGSACLQKWRVA